MFTKDTRTESFLSQMGVQFTLSKNLSIKELPKGWDTRNRGRPIALRENAVLDYGCLMESGSPAPAVIVRKDGEKIAILDGLQRLAAAREAGFDRFSAYVVTTDSEDVLVAIRVLANTRLQGHAEPVEWTKRNAVQQLIIDRKMNPEEVAAMGGWKAADLRRLTTVLDWGFQIRCIGGPQSLSDGIVYQVADLTTQDELRRAHKPISAFLNAISKGRFSTSDAQPYIEEFFQPAAKAKVYETRLEEFLATPEVDTRLHGRVSPGLSLGVNLRRSLRTAITILDNAIEEGEDLRYVDEFFQLIKKIDNRLRKLAPHCKSPDLPRTPADKWT